MVWNESDWGFALCIPDQSTGRHPLVGDDLFVTNTKIPAKRTIGIANSIPDHPTRSALTPETLAGQPMGERCRPQCWVISHRSVRKLKTLPSLTAVLVPLPYQNRFYEPFSDRVKQTQPADSYRRSAGRKVPHNGRKEISAAKCNPALPS